MNRSIQVLLAEDGRPFRILLERELAGGGMTVELRRGSAADDLARGGFDDLVQDLDLPGPPGAGALRVLRASGPEGELAVVSDAGAGRAAEAAGALEPGPYTYLTRPLSREEVAALAHPEGAAARRVWPPGSASGLLAASPALARLLETIERVAPSPASVHVSGETGTGKSLVARALHETSDRFEGPFVVVNCSAFQETLLESELFGHEKGSFTGAAATKPGLFEAAHGGTLFLDEVGEMSPAMQAKLLTVLDTREVRRVGANRGRPVDVRVVSASNRDLDTEVRAGRFREDLVFRLRVIGLTVPPLRDRPDDIPRLLAFYLERFHRPDRPAKTLHPAALERLKLYRWPGNVRELANTVEGLVLLAPGPLIRPEDLPAALHAHADPPAPDEDEAPPPIAEIERLHILRALRFTGGKKAPAARLLGIDVKTLASKLRSYGVEGP